MNYTNLFEQAKSKNIEELEVYFSRNASTSIKLFESKVDEYKVSNVSGISLKGKYNGKAGSVYTEEINEEKLIKMLDQLILNATIIETVEEFSLFEGSKEYSTVKSYSEEINKIETRKKIELLKSIEKKVNVNEKIDKITGLIWSENENETKIFNSKGLDLSRKSNKILVYGSAVAEQDGKVVTGGEYIFINDIKDIDVTLLSNAIINNTIEQLGAVKPESGKYKTLLLNDVVGDLLEAMSSSFSAEITQKGLSKLEGKEEKKVFSKNITISDKPLLELGNNSTVFDDEGTATFDKLVVENGVLKTLLHNRKTAEKANIESTGNGFKQGYKGLVSVMPSNFRIENGENTLEELFEKVEDGIMITDLSGIHAGLNSITGDFSLQADGFFIKGGKKGNPVNLMTVSGNFFELLNDVNSVGNDGKTGFSGIGGPSLFINQLNVSGK